MWLFSVLPALLLLVSAPVMAEKLLIFGDDGYAPVVFFDRGVPSGLLPAILKRLERDTGDIYELHLVPWKRAYQSALNGEGGLIGFSYTKERAEIFDFSKAIYDDDVQIVVLREKRFSFKVAADLKGKTLGGVQGASYGEEVDRLIASGGFTVDRDLGQAGRLRKLLAGRLDGALIGNGNAGFNHAINSDEVLRDSRGKFEILPVPLARDALHLGFSKSMGRTAALARFDAALARLQRSAEWKSLMLSVAAR